MATNGIQVPVSLYIENLQKIINDLKGQLGNLKVGSSGFKAMENHIRALQKELDKFQIQASKPFLTENQFIAAEKSVDKLEDEIERVSLTASRLKFSDLELNGEQKAQLKAVEDQINAIKASFKTLKDTAKQSFLDTDLGQLWTKLHPEDTSRSLDQITNNIRRAVKEQGEAVKEAESVVDGYQRAITMGDAVKAMNKTHGKGQDPDALKALMGNEFSTFFKELKNGKIQFQDGQQGFFTAWLAKNFELDESVIKDLLKASGPRIAALLNDANSSIRQALNGAIVKADSARIQLPSANLNATEQDARLRELTATLNVATGATDGMKISEEQLREALTAAGITLENTKEGIAADVRAKQEWRNVNQQGTAELNNLRTALQQTNAQFLQQQRVTQNFNSMKMAVVNFMGFRQVLNLTRTAIREAINHIKELDSVMNKISIVTNMSTSDLWAQVDAYSKMAQQYGTTIKGAYEVSQIYYQQGLETKDVLTLTNETLKLAKVSGLDYATTTDYMTTALRGFKMEMSEASKVVDVYSNLAAHTAVSSEELAVAMSKTASSMESVGSTFEETSAMIGTMVAVTRESATNIGSALKSIASRYGEMKQDPLKLVDSEGDEMSYNKVDAALQSVGISMKTVDGQFRSFTEVIIELSEKWDQLESTQQRYIATQFAGNRQQSRFLALVSNPELLKANLGYAEESEDTGTLQALKALDSIESKLNQVQVAYQQFYTTLGAENVWKGLLDGATNVINTLNRLPKLFGKLPISAINAIGSIIVVIKNLGLSLLGVVAKGIQATLPQAKTGAETWTNTIINTVKGKTGEAEAAGKALGNALNKGLEGTKGLTAWGANNITKGQANNWNLTAKFASSAYATKEESQKAWTSLADQMKGAGVLTDEGFNIIKAGGQGALDIIERIRIAVLGEGNAAEESKGKLANWSTAHQKGLSNLQAFGSALNLVATAIDTSTTGGKQLSGTFMALSGVIVTTTAVIKAASDGFKTIPWVAIASGIISAVSGIMTIIQSFSLEAKLEEATKKAEELTNRAKELKANYRTLDTNVKKYKELEKARYDSAEAAEEYQNAVDELAEKFPQLISSFDESGNAILSAVSMENNLTQAREDAAKAALAAAKAEKEKAAIDLQKKQQDLSDAAFELKAKAERYAIGSADYARNHETGKTLKQNERNLLTLKNLLEEDTTDTGKEILSWINNNVKIPTNEHIIQTLFYKISESIGQGDYNQAAKLKNWTSDIYSLLNWDIGPIFSEVFNNVSTLLSEITPMANLITSSNKEIVNSWLRSSKYNTLPVIKNNGAFSIIQQAMLSSAKEDFSDIHLEQLSQDILEPFNTLWNMLSDNVQSQVNEILSHPENYTATDLQKIFSDAKVEQLVPQWIYNTFNEQNDSIREALTQKANLIITDQQKEIEVYGEFYTMLESETTQFTLNEQKFLVQALDQIASITDSGFSANSMMGAINDLFTQIQSLSYDARNAFLEQILTNGFSAEGWNKTLEYIKNNTQFNFNSINTNLINTIIKESIPNYTLAASSAIGEIEDSWESLDKFFSSLSKGVNQTEVDSLINQAQSLDLSLADTDFHADGENMIISATKLTSLIDDYQNRLSIPINNLKTDLEKTFNTLSDSFISLFDSNDQNGLISKEIIDSNLLDYYKRILNTDFGNYFQLNTNGEWTAILQEGESLEEAESRIWNAVQQHYQDNLSALNKVNNYYEILFTNLKKSLKWKSGDYSSLNNILKNGDKFEDILKNPEKLYSEEYINEPDIKSAFNQATQAYNNLLSDVLSKGLKNINLKDYEGLDNEIEIITDNISYRDFVNNYAQYANKTAAEINDLLIQAIQKDQAKVSSDVLKDLTFIDQDTFTTSLEGLKELANIYEVKAEDFNKWINEYYNAATGEATVRVSDLLKKYQIDLTKVNDFTQMVQESVDSLFNSLTSNIKNALSGSMDSKGTKNLTDTLRQLGLNAELSFTRTKDGYKLATEQVVQLYRELEQVDSITAQIVLDELNKSLDDATIKANGLQKEIDQLRATTESDSYKFMSNKIPSGQNNPINYYENWADALSKYQAALKTSSTTIDTNGNKVQNKGLIDYQDWYNIVMEMNNIAKLGGDIKLGAYTLNGDMQEVNRLLEASASALTVDSNGKVKIALGNIADLGIDFTSGAQDMAKNVDAGIKAYAKAQVKMLDGMIQLMETVVAMEQLGDVDTDHNNKLDLGEIFEFGDLEKAASNLDKVTEFTQTYRDSITKLIEWGNSDEGKGFKESAEKMKISWNGADITMWDLLNTSEATVMSWSDELKGNYASIISAFYEAAKSGNYNLDNVLASVKEVLAGTNYNGDIDVGDIHLTFHQGVVLTRDENGNYIVDGVPFDDVDIALRAQVASEVTAIEGATKEYDTKEGYVTFTAGEFSYTSKYTVESGYIVEFSDGDKATSQTKEGINFAINVWAQKNNLNAEDLTDPSSNVHSFTYTSKSGVTMNYEIDVQTGKLEFKNASGIGNEATGTEAANIERGAKAEANKIAQKAVEQTGPITGNATIDGNIIATLGENATVEADISGKTLTLKGTPGTVEFDESIQSIINDLTATITHFEKSEEANDPNELVNALTAQILSYTDEDALPPERLNELTATIKQYIEDPEATLPELTDIIQNILLGANEPADTIIDNDNLAIEESAEQDIINNENQTKEALDDNIKEAAEGVIQDITLVSNKVAEAIAANVKYGKENPVVQSIQLKPIGTTKDGDTVHIQYEQPEVKYTHDGKVFDPFGEAQGNVGNAKAKGTLLGELGPELVVSNGRYFIAGQNGAEVMDLADDAIVFNHLQTKSLLEKGMSNGRGKAVTNEKNAVSYAKGNINGGPAHASASAALSALKKLRAQWQALAGLSAQDLTTTAGGGGGGGNKEFIKDLERWYNWLQEIAKLEKKINYEEALRSKMQSAFERDGKDYFNSQQRTLKFLERQKQIQQDLVDQQTAFFEKRRAELNSSNNPFSQFYTYDEEGQIKYTNRQFTYNGQTFNGGFEALAEINKTDAYGNQVYNAKEQLAMMKAFLGEDIVNKYSKNADGSKREETDILEAMWSSMEGNNSEIQGTRDSIEDGNKTLEDYAKQQYDILHEIEDNQISVENRVLKALEDSRKREIDELSKQKDAIEKSSSALIDGLSQSLQKERSMYQNQQNKADLESKRRQLAILQRSGGSAAEIHSLQEQIDSASQEEYFNKQQEQIDALQEASDTQIQKMQEQIDIMNESLEYQKEYGLLWDQVYEIMNNKTPKDIADYIKANDSEYWGQSPTDLGKNMRDALFEAEQYKAYAKNGADVKDLVTQIADEVVAERKAEKEKADAEAETSQENTNSSGNEDSNNDDDNKSKKKEYYNVYDERGIKTNYTVQAASSKEAQRLVEKQYGKRFSAGQTISDEEKKELDANLNKYNHGYSFSFNGKEYAEKSFSTSKEEAYEAAVKRINGLNIKGVPSSAVQAAKEAAIKTIKAYDIGGMVDQTGLAYLHAKEGVLTAEQTSILRNEILGNDRNSLLNLLQDFRAAYGNIANNSTYNTSSEAIVIEHAEVNMHVDQLANGYDSARAADDIMKEMLNIARKTNAQNRIGR